MFHRCEEKYGKGNCEEYGAIVYPKCKEGYHNFGCCICRPNSFSCTKLGYEGQLDLSCAKKIIIGKPTLMKCAEDEEEDAGLCYKKCKDGYKGIGPVCWMSAPKGWTNCGFGAADNIGDCVKVVFDQLESIGMLVINIATFGAASEVDEVGEEISSDIENEAELKTSFEKLKKLWNDSSEMRDLIKKAKKIRSLVNTAQLADKIATADPNSVKPADMVRMAAAAAAILDPTGVSGVVSNFSYPKCSDVSTN